VSFGVRVASEFSHSTRRVFASLAQDVVVRGGILVPVLAKATIGKATVRHDTLAPKGW